MSAKKMKSGKNEKQTEKDMPKAKTSKTPRAQERSTGAPEVPLPTSEELGAFKEAVEAATGDSGADARAETAEAPSDDASEPVAGPTTEPLAEEAPVAPDAPAAEEDAPSRNTGAVGANLEQQAPMGHPDATAAPEANSARDTPKADTPDLAALRVDVEDAKAGLAAAEADAKKLEDQARTTLTAAKERYRTALAPYRDACKVQGKECEYEGGRTRTANVTERVTFEVEVQGEHIRIAVKGRPETDERIPIEEVRSSPNKAAQVYTEKHLGPKEVIGNKMGSLGNRLRAVLATVPVASSAKASE